MAVKKVVINGKTKIDLTQDNIAAENVTKGIKFHLPNGEQGVGTKVDGQLTPEGELSVKQFIKKDFSGPDLYLLPYDTLQKWMFNEGDGNHTNPYDFTSIQKIVYPENIIKYGVVGSIEPLDYYSPSTLSAKKILDIIQIQPIDNDNNIILPSDNQDITFYTPTEIYHGIAPTYEINGQIKENITNNDFDNCTSICAFAFYQNYNLAWPDTLVLPEGLEYIYSYAFAGSSLLRIKFPSTLKQIGDQALGNAIRHDVILPENINYLNQPFNYGLFRGIKINAIEPPVLDNGSNLFYDYEEDGGNIIIVPTNTASKYKKATGWSYWIDDIYDEGTDLIFTINDNTFSFKAGITWQEYIAQSNDSGFSIVDDEIYYNGNPLGQQDVYSDSFIRPTQYR